MEKQKHQKVLIIDDTPAVIDFVRDILLKEGYQVFVAVSGQRGLEIVEKVNPDIILLDILMPDLNGYETCSFLKSNKRTADIPVIFMSALVETSDKMKGFKEGAVDYLTKPLNSEELVIRVRTHLSLVEKNKQERESVRQVNNAIVRSLGVIVYEYDVINDVISWSDTVNETLGFTQKELGENFEKFLLRVLPNHRELMQGEINRAIETHQSVNFDFQLSTKDHRYVWFQNKANVLLDELTGKPSHLIGVFLDMTERKAQEKKSVQNIIHAIELERQQIKRKLDVSYTRVMSNIDSSSLGHREDKNGLSSIEELMLETKKLIKKLSPPVLLDEGLNQSIECLIKDSVPKQVTVKFHDNSVGTPNLPKHISMVILNMTKEILNNIITNDDVTIISLQLHSSDKAVFYTIEDDGNGGSGKDSVELQNLKYRVASVGGLIEVNNVPNKGTLFTIDFDIEDNE